MKEAIRILKRQGYTPVRVGSGFAGYWQSPDGRRVCLTAEGQILSGADLRAKWAPFAGEFPRAARAITLLTRNWG